MSKTAMFQDLQDLCSTLEKEVPPKTQKKPAVGLMGHDLVVFSHLRWDLVFQRPQHLLTRFAKHSRVFYVEEPVFVADANPTLCPYTLTEREKGVRLVVPQLPHGLTEHEINVTLRAIVDELMAEECISDAVFWYYTPMALGFTDHLTPSAVVYDCMDELSLFKGAPAKLLHHEIDLFSQADVVFTGGHHLYEHKRGKHANIHAFPSSIDRHHFAQARSANPTPADQVGIAGPRIGFFGVVDERFDIDLVESVARARPDWSFVVIGPVVKISFDDLPKLPNIHYLGSKHYSQLPSYLAGWDAAILPFARNESTRFISPTKTPEYLAAGKPVVSTSIHDVVRPYGEAGLVHIADSPEEFIRALELALRDGKCGQSWLERVDQFLADKSWDSTWSQMSAHVEEALGRAISARAMQAS